MKFQMGACGELSVAWLTQMDSSAALREIVVQDVADRLDSMPSHLRVLFGVVDTGLYSLPAGLRRRVSGLPGFSEYARVVESLTAVSFFDAVTRSAAIPAPRGDDSERVLAEPRQ